MEDNIDPAAETVGAETSSQSRTDFRDDSLALSSYLRRRRDKKQYALLRTPTNHPDINRSAQNTPDPTNTRLIASLGGSGIKSPPSSTNVASMTSNKTTEHTITTSNILSMTHPSTAVPPMDTYNFPDDNFLYDPDTFDLSPNYTEGPPSSTISPTRAAYSSMPNYEQYDTLAVDITGLKILLRTALREKHDLHQKYTLLQDEYHKLQTEYQLLRSTKDQQYQMIFTTGYKWKLPSLLYTYWMLATTEKQYPEQYKAPHRTIYWAYLKSKLSSTFHRWKSQVYASIYQQFRLEKRHSICQTARKNILTFRQKRIMAAFHRWHETIHIHHAQSIVRIHYISQILTKKWYLQSSFQTWKAFAKQAKQLRKVIQRWFQYQRKVLSAWNQWKKYIHMRQIQCYYQTQQSRQFHLYRQCVHYVYEKPLAALQLHSAFVMWKHQCTVITMRQQLYRQYDWKQRRIWYTFCRKYGHQRPLYTAFHQWKQVNYLFPRILTNGYVQSRVLIKCLTNWKLHIHQAFARWKMHRLMVAKWMYSIKQVHQLYRKYQLRITMSHWKTWSHLQKYQNLQVSSIQQKQILSLKRFVQSKQQQNRIIIMSFHHWLQYTHALRQVSGLQHTLYEENVHSHELQSQVTNQQSEFQAQMIAYEEVHHRLLTITQQKVLSILAGKYSLLPKVSYAFQKWKYVVFLYPQDMEKLQEQKKRSLQCIQMKCFIDRILLHAHHVEVKHSFAHWKSLYWHSKYAVKVIASIRAWMVKRSLYRAYQHWKRSIQQQYQFEHIRRVFLRYDYQSIMQQAWKKWLRYTKQIYPQLHHRLSRLNAIFARFILVDALAIWKYHTIQLPQQYKMQQLAIDNRRHLIMNGLLKWKLLRCSHKSVLQSMKRLSLQWRHSRRHKAFHHWKKFFYRGKTLARILYHRLYTVYLWKAWLQWKEYKSFSIQHQLHHQYNQELQGIQAEYVSLQKRSNNQVSDSIEQFYQLMDKQDLIKDKVFVMHRERGLLLSCFSQWKEYHRKYQRWISRQEKIRLQILSRRFYAWYRSYHIQIASHQVTKSLNSYTHYQHQYQVKHLWFHRWKEYIELYPKRLMVLKWFMQKYSLDALRGGFDTWYRFTHSRLPIQRIRTLQRVFHEWKEYNARHRLYSYACKHTIRSIFITFLFRKAWKQWKAYTRRLTIISSWKKTLPRLALYREESRLSVAFHEWKAKIFTAGFISHCMYRVYKLAYKTKLFHAWQQWKSVIALRQQRHLALVHSLRIHTFCNRTHLPAAWMKWKELNLFINAKVLFLKVQYKACRYVRKKRVLYRIWSNWIHAMINNGNSTYAIRRRFYQLATETSQHTILSMSIPLSLSLPFSRTFPHSYSSSLSIPQPPEQKVTNQQPLSVPSSHPSNVPYTISSSQGKPPTMCGITSSLEAIEQTLCLDERYMKQILECSSLQEFIIVSEMLLEQLIAMSMDAVLPLLPRKNKQENEEEIPTEQTRNRKRSNAPVPIQKKPRYTCQFYWSRSSDHVLCGYDRRQYGTTTTAIPKESMQPEAEDEEKNDMKEHGEYYLLGEGIIGQCAQSLYSSLYHYPLPAEIAEEETFAEEEAAVKARKQRHHKRYQSDEETDEDEEHTKSNKEQQEVKMKHRNKQKSSRNSPQISAATKDRFSTYFPSLILIPCISPITKECIGVLKLMLTTTTHLPASINSPLPLPLPLPALPLPLPTPRHHCYTSSTLQSCLQIFTCSLSFPSTMIHSLLWHMRMIMQIYVQHSSFSSWPYTLWQIQYQQEQLLAPGEEEIKSNSESAKAKALKVIHAKEDISDEGYHTKQRGNMIDCAQQTDRNTFHPDHILTTSVTTSSTTAITDLDRQNAKTVAKEALPPTTTLSADRPSTSTSPYLLHFPSHSNNKSLDVMVLGLQSQLKKLRKEIVSKESHIDSLQQTIEQHLSSISVYEEEKQRFDAQQTASEEDMKRMETTVRLLEDEKQQLIKKLKECVIRIRRYQEQEMGMEKLNRVLRAATSSSSSSSTDI